MAEITRLAYAHKKNAKERRVYLRTEDVSNEVDWCPDYTTEHNYFIETSLEFPDRLILIDKYHFPLQSAVQPIRITDQKPIFVEDLPMLLAASVFQPLSATPQRTPIGDLMIDVESGVPQHIIDKTILLMDYIDRRKGGKGILPTQTDEEAEAEEKTATEKAEEDLQHRFGFCTYGSLERQREIVSAMREVVKCWIDEALKKQRREQLIANHPLTIRSFSKP